MAERTTLEAWRSAVPMSLFAFALSACGDDNTTGMNPPPDPTPVACSASPASLVYVSNNGSGNAGTITVVDQAFASAGISLTPGNNEGIAFDGADNLWQNGDGAQIGLRVFASVGTRASGSAYDPSRDREISGGTTALTAPKGIDIAYGYAFVADFGAGDIKVFTTADGANAAPTATVATGGAAPWDVDYVPADDRLFAALTDGTIAVYDNFIGAVGASIGAGGVSRTIVPSDAAGVKISTNIHGIAYASNDRLVATDVGDAMVATDGSLYVITGASTASGAVTPASVITGPSTMLGNPVDVVLNGPDALIAEKSNDRLLAFCNVFAGNTGDLPPSLSVAQTKPEALALRATATPAFTDVSDLDAGVSLAATIATSNPAALASDALVRIATDLSAGAGSSTGFTGIGSIESATIDQNGDGLLTYDAAVASTGGILAVSQLASGRGAATVGAGARAIEGASTGLVAPKGLDLASNLGLLFVADFGASNIKAFSATAGGDAAPVFTIASVGAASVWDVDYDPAADRLYASGTDGTVLVYDNVSTTQGAAGPDRSIVPSDAVGTKLSVNLHGIDYLASADVLLLTDVGDAASATDGQLFLVPLAATADGNTIVTAQVGGAATKLGNPVDITTDGTSVYVAEKSNGSVLRYDNFLGLTGALNVAEDAAFTIAAPESVVLAPGRFVF
ncbi:MAG: hypothetical protein ABIQ49_04000 [Gemmatimonadales bacterium]